MGRGIAKYRGFSRETIVSKRKKSDGWQAMTEHWDDAESPTRLMKCGTVKNQGNLERTRFLPRGARSPGGLVERASVRGEESGVHRKDPQGSRCMRTKGETLPEGPERGQWDVPASRSPLVSGCFPSSELSERQGLWSAGGHPGGRRLSGATNVVEEEGAVLLAQLTAGSCQSSRGQN